jgi:hypothetical protein
MFTMPGWTMFATVCASSFPEAAAGRAPDGGTGIPLTLVPGVLPGEGAAEPAGLALGDLPGPGVADAPLWAAVPGPGLLRSVITAPAPTAAARTATTSSVRGCPRLRGGGGGGSGTGW